MRRGVRTAAVVAFAGVVVAAVVVVVQHQRRTPRPEHRVAPARPAVGAPVAAAPVLAPAGLRDPMPTPAGLARVLAATARQRGLGPRVGYSVVDVGTGRALAGAGGARPATPASVLKLTTATAVLIHPGSAARITTRVMVGSTPGEVVLVGAGDPTLSVGPHQAYPGGGRLDLLARAVRRAAAGRVRRLLLDTSAYSGPSSAPGWDSDLVSSGNVAPITALMVDGGRRAPDRRDRTPTPDLAAGRAFAGLLGLPAGAVRRGRAPAHARELARVSSAPIATLVEQMLAVSDNVLAEALARQVAVHRGTPASFAGAAEAVRATLVEAGVSTAGLRLFDGSGLSHRDLVTPDLVTRLLVAAAGPARPQLRTVLTGLPVAGFSGTLTDRFAGAPARSGAGQVRAKTGTLSGVSTLAGVVRDRDGRLLAFAVLADRVPPGATDRAESALDDVAAALSRCGCR